MTGIGSMVGDEEAPGNVSLADVASWMRRGITPSRAQPDFYESREWLDLRYRVLKASNGMCQCCGHRGDKYNPLQVDHILPRSKCPELALEINNLQVLCRHCNLGKGAKDSTDWRFMPSKELSILNDIAPERRFRLQQLGWLKVNGETKEERLEAHREYRRLWRECEQEWLSSREAAQ